MAFDMVDPNCTTSNRTHFPIVRQWHTTSWSLSRVGLSHHSGLGKLFSIRSFTHKYWRRNCRACNKWVHMWVKHAKAFLSDTDYGWHKPWSINRGFGKSDWSVLAGILEPHDSLVFSFCKPFPFVIDLLTCTIGSSVCLCAPRALLAEVMGRCAPMTTAIMHCSQDVSAMHDYWI